MAQPIVSLFIDVQNRQLVRSFTSTAPAILAPVYQGDTVTYVQRFMQATGVSTAPYTDLDYSAGSVTLAVGFIGARPSSGLFTVTDPATGQTTAPLPYNVTATQLQAAIQAALTTNWSNATVTGVQGGPFTITNGSNGAQVALLGTAVTLDPLSSVPINRLQEGSDTLPEIQILSLTVKPMTLQDTWTASTSPDTLTGAVPFNTAGIEQAMGNLPCINPTLSIQVIPVSGEPFTVYQNNFTIKNDLIVGAPEVPTPGVSYYTTAQSDARYKGIHVERDSSGNTAQHIVTANAGPNNILYLLSGNTSGTVSFTFDNGTFDGQTLTYRTATALSSITYSANVAGVLGDGDDSITEETSLSFLWDIITGSWLPI